MLKIKRFQLLFGQFFVFLVENSVEYVNNSA